MDEREKSMQRVEVICQSLSPLYLPRVLSMLVSEYGQLEGEDRFRILLLSSPGRLKLESERDGSGSLTFLMTWPWPLTRDLDDTRTRIRCEILGSGLYVLAPAVKVLKAGRGAHLMSLLGYVGPRDLEALERDVELHACLESLLDQIT